MSGRLFLVACVATLVLVAGFLGCRSILPNHDPTIQSITGSSSVYSGGYLGLTCEATDQDGDDLTYTWTCTSGTLSSSTGKTVAWTAPIQSGTATIEVTVRDGRGGADTQGKTITVTAVTTTLIDWDGQVVAGQYIYWTEWLEADYTVSGQFWVDNYDINFLILNEANYENWSNGNSYSSVVNVQRSSGTSFSATINTTGTYYVVLDNTFSLFTDKFGHVLVESTSP